MLAGPLLVAFGGPWLLDALTGPSEEIRRAVGVDVPEGADDYETGCDDAFMDPDCWLSFAMPGEEVPAFRRRWRSGHPAAPFRVRRVEELERRLAAMNEDWSDVEIERGAVTPPAGCQESDALLDLSDPERVVVYARLVQC